MYIHKSSSFSDFQIHTTSRSGESNVTPTSGGDQNQNQQSNSRNSSAELGKLHTFWWIPHHFSQFQFLILFPQLIIIRKVCHWVFVFRS